MLESQLVEEPSLLLYSENRKMLPPDTLKLPSPNNPPWQLSNQQRWHWCGRLRLPLSSALPHGRGMDYH